MEKTLLRVALSLTIAASALVPASALAYLSPQDVFDPAQGGTDLTQTMIQTPRYESPVQAPPTQREGDQVIAVQQQKSAALREQAQSQLKSIDTPPADTYVAPASTKPSMLDDANNYAVRQQRIAEQKASSPTIVIAGPGVTVDSNGRVLHSGAPLITSTGPETTIAFIVMVLAGLSTLAFTFTKGRMTHPVLPRIAQ